jgi:DNA damage-inducible protein 1
LAIGNIAIQAQPELAAAAQSDPARFAELLSHTRERQYEAEIAEQNEIERLNMDPFDVEAQRKIEEAIRQQAVMENMQHALEYSPEFFGRVTML